VHVGRALVEVAVLLLALGECAIRLAEALVDLALEPSSSWRDMSSNVCPSTPISSPRSRPARAVRSPAAIRPLSPARPWIGRAIAPANQNVTTIARIATIDMNAIRSRVIRAIGAVSVASGTM
jgi:hypothetical protein